MNDECKTEEVILQENGIVRDATGMIIGRLVENVDVFAERNYRMGYEAALYRSQTLIAKLLEDYKKNLSQ